MVFERAGTENAPRPVDVIDGTTLAVRALSPVAHAPDLGVAMRDGRVLLLGSELSVYDPQTGSVQALPSDGNAVRSAVRLADGRVLLIGDPVPSGGLWAGIFTP